MGCKSTEEMEFMQESNQVQAETGKTMQEAMEIVRKRREEVLKKKQEETYGR